MVARAEGFRGRGKRRWIKYTTISEAAFKFWDPGVIAEISGLLMSSCGFTMHSFDGNASFFIHENVRKMKHFFNQQNQPEPDEG